MEMPQYISMRIVCPIQTTETFDFETCLKCKWFDSYSHKSVRCRKTISPSTKINSSLRVCLGG